MISLWDAAFLTVQNQGQVWDKSSSLNCSNPASLKSGGKPSSKSRTRTHQQDEGALPTAQMDYIGAKGFLEGVPFITSLIRRPESLPSSFPLSSLVSLPQPFKGWDGVAKRRLWVSLVNTIC